ncbi:hypothetical protein CF121_06660 [Aeromonas media]|nr:hypothetical protein CF121_06660 [Aeromonas media]
MVLACGFIDKVELDRVGCFKYSPVEGATGRSFADAPEIDGLVYLNGETDLKLGDLVKVRIDEADEYDLWASLVN